MQINSIVFGFKIEDDLIKMLLIKSICNIAILLLMLFVTAILN